MKKISMEISRNEVTKRIDDSIIANSILVILFSGILLSLSIQHLMTTDFIYLEAAILGFAALVVGSHGQKMIFTALVFAVYSAFFGFVIWSTYSMYITGNANIFGVVLFIMIPAYIFYLNLGAFSGSLRFKLRNRNIKSD